MQVNVKMLCLLQKESKKNFPIKAYTKHSKEEYSSIEELQFDYDLNEDYIEYGDSIYYDLSGWYD